MAHQQGEGTYRPSRRTVLHAGLAVGAAGALGPVLASDRVRASPPSNTITDCTRITEPGHYVLGDDIDGSDTGICLFIETNDVHLDGRGHTLDGGGTGAVGIQAGEYLGFTVENITVRNLTVTNFRNAGLAFEEVRSGTIQNVTATANGPASAGLGYGILFRNAIDVSVSRSRATNNVIGVFSEEGSVRNKIARNTISNNDLMGAFFTDHSDENRLHANQITWNGSTGLVIGEGGDELEVIANVVEHNQGTGIALSELVGGLLRRNTVGQNGEDGIQLSYLAGVDLHKNDAVDNDRHGIALVNADDNLLRHNVALDNGGENIFIDANSTGNVLERNTTD